MDLYIDISVGTKVGRSDNIGVYSDSGDKFVNGDI